MKVGTYKSVRTVGEVEYWIVEGRCPARLGVLACKRRAHATGMHECPISVDEVAVWENRRNGNSG